MKLYDDDGHEITNPAMLKALNTLAELIAGMENGQEEEKTDKKPEEDTYDDIIVYDDDGRRITNIATLRAIRESDEIAEERRKRWGIIDDDECKKVS